MRRLLSLLAMGLLLAVAAVIPAPAGPDPEEAEVPSGPVGAGRGGYFHCPWSVRDNFTASRYALVSTAPSSFLISHLANGRMLPGPVGSVAAGGGFSVPNTRVIGNTPAVVEMSSAPSAAAVTGAGERLSAAYLCPAASPGVWHLPGGSANEGEVLTLYVLNPFTEDARVSLRVFSEFGAESARDLELLSISARRMRRFDLHDLFPGRRSLAVMVEQTDGLVAPAMAWGMPEDLAVWPGSRPDEAWEFPTAGVDGMAADLVLANESLIEVTVTMEVFDEVRSLLESAQHVIPGPGLVRIPLGEVPVRDFGVRLTGDLPFSAALVGADGPATAAAAGASALAEEWLVPGPGTASADFRLRILNTGVSDIAVSLRNAGITGSGGSGPGETVTVPAGSIVTVDAADAGMAGLLASGSASYSVAWWARDEQGRIMLGEAHPVDP